ncbi:hypothetical protein B0T18DRAFT_158650 [Schizothecium vesticola]|uniref:Uncharacterized protein n=1 Tax=Schizothecium vesticola TaxID=314040 RepID=A0AA40EWL3_9PEZI|nr:hypothetical protein B0T18DRAFT_158650 [Schizothecium vesticola]
MENSRRKQRLFAQRPKVREARFLPSFRKKDTDPDEDREEVEGGPPLADLIKGKGKGKGKAVVVNGPLFTIVTTVGPEVTRTIVATSVLTLEPSPPPPPPPPPPPTTTPTPAAAPEPTKALTPLFPVPVLPVQTLTPLVPTRIETQTPQESSSSLVESSSSLIESSSSLVESSTTLVEPSSTTADVAVDVPTTFSTVTIPPGGSTPYAGGSSPEATNGPTGLPAPILSRLSSGQVAGIVAGTAVGFIIILGALLFAMRKWRFGFFRRQNPDGSPSSSQRRMRLSSIFTRNNSPSRQFGYSAYATADRRYSSSTASPFLDRPRQVLAGWLDRVTQLLPTSRAHRTEPMPVVSEKAPPYYGAILTKPKPSRRNLMGRMKDRLPISRPIPPPVPPHDIESSAHYPPPPTITMTPPAEPPRRSIGSIVSTIFNIRRSQGPTPPPKTKGFLAPSTRGRGTPTSDDSTPGAYIFRQSGTSDLSGWTGPATRTSRTDSGAFIAPTALSPPLTHPRYAFGGTERDPFGRVVVRSPIAAGDRRRTVRFSMQRVDSSGQVAGHGRVRVDTSPTSGSGSGSGNLTGSEYARSGTRASLVSDDSGEREREENRI